MTIPQLKQRGAESEREFATLTNIAPTVASTLDLNELLSVILDQPKTLID